MCPTLQMTQDERLPIASREPLDLAIEKQSPVGPLDLIKDDGLRLGHEPLASQTLGTLARGPEADSPGDAVKPSRE